MGGGRPITRKSVRRALAAAGIHLLYRLLGALHRGFARRFCHLLGNLAWHMDRRGRTVSLENLELALGNRSSPQLRRTIGRSAYINLATNLVDLSRIRRNSVDDLDNLVTDGHESMQHIDRAVRAQQGIILLTPHLGNWELLTAYLASRGAPVHFVGREPYDERLDHIYEAIRGSHGARWIRRGGAFEQLRALLGEGELAILLMDQDTRRVQGTFVEFFGAPAWTPTGPVALARLTGAALIPGALIRREDHTYQLVLEPPIRTVKTTDDAYNDWENTRRATLALESLIERYPAQWVWFHRRWRTKPPPDWTPPAPPSMNDIYSIRPGSGP
jgi:KDO2-lipid IV(A) lauroyltransferase